MVKIKNETLYVVYFDNLPYETNTGNSLKIAYPNIGSARAIISKYSEREAELEYDASLNNWISWYEINDKNKSKLIKSYEDRFSIVEYKREKEQIK